MPQEYYSLSHSGIKGMKWGIRRWRNYDDTLTEAGKKRYGVGGVKAQRKAEKARRRREEIMSDPKKLYKHRHEFTTSELESARARFDTQAKIREQADKERLEKLERKMNKRLVKEKAEADIKEARTRGEMAEQKLKAARAEEERKAKISKSDEARKQRDEDRKVAKDKQERKDKRLGRIADKLKNILGISTYSKTIFDEIGMSDPKSGRTLFGSLGKALGIGKKSAKEAAEDSKLKNAKEAVKSVVGEEKADEILKTSVEDAVVLSELSHVPLKTNAYENVEKTILRGNTPKFEDLVDNRFFGTKAYKENSQKYDTLFDIPLDTLEGIDFSDWKQKK